MCVYLRCQDAEKTPIKIDECENPVEISVLIEYMMRGYNVRIARFKLIAWKRFHIHMKKIDCGVKKRLQFQLLLNYVIDPLMSTSLSRSKKKLTLI